MWNVPEVEPRAWPLLVGLLVVLVIVRRLPGNHPLRLIWSELAQRESQAAWLLGLPVCPGPGSLAGRVAFWLVGAGLLAAALASLGAWLSGTI